MLESGERAGHLPRRQLAPGGLGLNGGAGCVEVLQAAAAGPRSSLSNLTASRRRPLLGLAERQSAQRPVARDRACPVPSTPEMPGGSSGVTLAMRPVVLA